jgi:hypothetical protein
MRPSINGREVREQGCPRARLHRLNSSPPGPCSPLGNDAETRCLAVAGSYEESGELPGRTEPRCGGHTDERRPYRQTEPFFATAGLPTGDNTHGDRVPVVAQRPG